MVDNKNSNTYIAKKSAPGGLWKWPYIFVSPYLIAYMAFYLFPILYSFYISLFRWNVGEKKTFIGLNNYIKLFTTDPYFLKSVFNTVIIIAFAIPIVIFLGLILAEILFDEKMKHRGLFQTINFLPYITTPVAVGLIFNIIFDQKIGIVNIILVKMGIFSEGINWLTAPGYLQRIMLILMIVWQWFGYYMLMYLAGISSISNDVYEAAIIDGSSRISTFFKITIPLLKPVTVFLSITSVINGLQLMDQPYLLMRGLNQGSVQSLDKPLMTVMVNFMDQSVTNGRLGHGAAVTFGLFLIIMVFTYIGISFLRRRGDAI